MSLIQILRSGSAGQRVRLIGLLAFLAICLLAGGASRADEWQQVPVRLAAIALIAACAYHLGRSQLRGIRAPLLLFGAIGLLAIVQLIPLPHAMFAAAPGRAPYDAVLRDSGLGDSWHALSLTPDMTLNSMLALLPPIAVLLALASLPSRIRLDLLPVIIGGILLSALLGLLQISNGSSGPYFFNVTNPGFPVGVFANRNHQALAIAMCIPLLAAWSGYPRDGDRYRWHRVIGAILCCFFLLPLILVAGSRMALILAITVSIPAFGFFGMSQWKRAWQATSRRPYLRLAPFAALIAVVAATFFGAKATSFDRLFSVNVRVDERYSNLPAMFKMIHDSFPFGFGLGSFESVFRAYEADETLALDYFNHAHNDFLEIVIDAGLVGVLIAIGFAAWLLWRSYLAWRSPARSRRGMLGRLASFMLVMMAAASVVDYPLRTPFFGAMFALCCGWLLVADDEWAEERSAGVTGT